MKNIVFRSVIIFSLLLVQVSFAFAAVPTVTLKSPTAIRSTSIILNASISGGGSSTVYGFEYGPTIDYRFATNDFANLRNNTFSKDIYGLTCNTEYHYRAYVENSSGHANTPDSVFKTAACANSNTASTTNSINEDSGGNNSTQSGTGVITTDIDLTDPVDLNSPTGPASQTSGNTTSNQPGAVKLDYSGWVKCDGVVTDSEQYRQNKCDFVELINTVKSLINWAFMISIPIIIGIIAYAGFLYMTGTEANIKKAKEFIWNAIIGFVIMLSAWFIVTFVLNQLLTDQFKQVTGTLVETKK
jgi:hypothetical protein